MKVIVNSVRKSIQLSRSTSINSSWCPILFLPNKEDYLFKKGNIINTWCWARFPSAFHSHNPLLQDFAPQWSSHLTSRLNCDTIASELNHTVMYLRQQIIRSHFSVFWTSFLCSLNGLKPPLQTTLKVIQPRQHGIIQGYDSSFTVKPNILFLRC